MNWKSYFKNFGGSIQIIYELAAVFLIFKALVPIFAWYFSKFPAYGVDLFNSITYVSYHLRNFALPFAGFKDIWFGGYPLMLDFPQFIFYLMMPFGAKFGPSLGVQVFAMFSLFVFAFACYLLFFRLSKNFGVSIFLAASVLLSANIYSSLTWAGSIPYFASQSFFPLGLLFAVYYFEKPNLRNLLLLAMVSAFGFLIHPLTILGFLMPAVFLFITFASVASNRKLVSIIKNLSIFSLVFVLATFIVTYKYLLDIGTLFDALKPTATVAVAVGESYTRAGVSTAFLKAQVPRLIENTDENIFKLFGLGAVLVLVALVFGRRKKGLLLLVCCAFVALYTVAHPFLNLGGYFNFFWHDPYRAFWQFSVAMAALAAAFWGYFAAVVSDKLNANIYLRILSIKVGAVLSLVFLVLSYIIYTNKIEPLLAKIDSTSTLRELSSTYPEAISLDLNRQAQQQLSSQLLPSFINENEKNFRMYSADATVSIWWNSFFDIPLSRGYVDPPLNTVQRGGLFWLDIAIANDSLVRDFKYDEKTAYANGLFLIDWNGLGYFEGGREGVKGPSAPPSSYLVKNSVFDKEEEVTTYGSLSKWATESDVPELNLDAAQNLKFFKIKDELTSPILYPTDASAVIIFSTRGAYEDILRVLASQNINSRRLIPVYGGEYIDEVSADRLRAFDAVFLHQYKYHSKGKAFGNLSKYVKEGGKLFIDTGGDVKEASSRDLPDVFPIEASTREGMGEVWELKSTEDPLVAEVSLDKFGPLVFDGDDWKLTTGKAREGAKILLTHRNQPILATKDFGKGKVVWSGINLPFHYNQYKSDDEAKLFINILSQFTDVSDREPIDARTQWLRPEKVAIETDEKPRGILFKEQGWSGWSARLSGTSQKLPLYLAGPSYPGFMYAPLEGVKFGTPLAVQFSYRGTLTYWFSSLITFLTVFLILEWAIFNGNLVSRRFFPIGRKLQGALVGWWKREEE